MSKRSTPDIGFRFHSNCSAARPSIASLSFAVPGWRSPPLDHLAHLFFPLLDVRSSDGIDEKLTNTGARCSRMTYSHFSRDFADFIRPVLSLFSKSEAAYSVKSIL